MHKFVLCSGLALWLASAPLQAETPVAGGVITLTFKDDVSTLDPAIGYDLQNWSLIKSLFDTLVDYEPGTTRLRMGLAESYETGAEGLSYIFHLRPGVRFHNGREMQAEDVVWSLNRAVDPATGSPGQAFFSMIEGYEAAAAGQAPLSGVTAPDARTVEIRLSRPDATFLHVLALNFASVLPAEAVEAAGAGFGFAPVGTGAFRFSEWKRGSHLLLKKNTHYWRPGIPYLDALSIEIGDEPSAALARARQGEVDILGDGIPASRFVEVMSDPLLSKQVVEGGQLHTSYITMNVKQPPFDRPEVRRAVSMAINKDRIIGVISGRAIPANQPLPPLMPGHLRDYPGYPYDPKAAGRLLARVGLNEGFAAEMLVVDTDPNPRIAEVMRQELRAIGINVTILALPMPEVIARAGAGEAQMVWSGGLAWVSDYPDPSNFYLPLLSCAAARPGGWNWTKLCRPDLDVRAAAANSMTAADQQEQRLNRWSSVFRDIMAEAPWVPVFHEQRFTLRSARLGGADELYVDPVSVPVNYDYIYLIK
ncbi:ABC transporter substrate-binding protein [Pseudogemmobacter faecipullorum]|uniref:ABC transporter substrate-binding protein n=1 Tax=Pseudogemmobacter faecipullorum TaxID=2755041 RepID=A0ABS8CHU7_9RHOB|nr:ABC transporter substrate-binding protein [Pseudogemmobacter faecipullorum]MCB5408720.1 ABC transporter substrate-binding protein [Pseudogemmobacter faecipullorum]